MTEAELKTYVQQLAGEVVDDCVDNFEFIVKRALATYSKFIPRVDKQILIYNLSYQFAAPYPRFVVVSSVDGLTERFMWSAEPLFVYDKNTGYLRIRSTGAFYVKAAYDHVLEDITIEDDELFIDLVYAYYLIATGSKRKAFKMGDIPFENDGDDRVSRGQELLKEKEEELSANSPIDLLVI